MIVAIQVLYRLYTEILHESADALHPLDWSLLGISVALCLLNTTKTKERISSESELTEPLLTDEEAATIVEEEEESYHVQLSDLYKVCHPDRWLILGALVFLLGTAICQIYVPKLTGDILDELIDHTGGFLRNVQLLVLVSILAGIFGGIRGAIFTMVGARINVRLRILLMDALLSLDVGFYDTTRTGDITSRLSSDTTLVGSSIMTNVNIFLRSSIRAIGVLGFMFAMSWRLSLLAFITVPIVTVLSKWYGKYIRELTKLQQEKLADGNSISESTISSMPTVKAFGAESAEMQEFEVCMQHYLNLNFKTAIATMGYVACVNALPQLARALVLYYGGLLVQSQGPGHISGGQLVSFILYLTSLSESFNSLGGIYANLVRAIGAADKIFELMNTLSKLTPPSHTDAEIVERALSSRQTNIVGIETSRVIESRAAGLYPESCLGRITFHNVDFRYPSRPQRVVLNQMSFDIEPGTVVALVGASGSGKSSIVKLIQHLYEPSSGEITIDGTPVHELSMDWLSKHVSIVSQDPVIYAKSIRSNIIYGLEGTDEEPSQTEVESASRNSNADSFINTFPDQYETTVGERGIQLSGGQRQRLALARALVRKPRILLLDEATSALDAESEHLVASAISDMITNERSQHGEVTSSTTVIVIAHRLSTIRNSDRILVVDEGHIVEDGSHDDLIQRGGIYCSLVKRQLGVSEMGDRDMTASISNGSTNYTMGGNNAMEDSGFSSDPESQTTDSPDRAYPWSHFTDQSRRSSKSEGYEMDLQNSPENDQIRQLLRFSQRQTSKRADPSTPADSDQILSFQFDSTPAKLPEPAYMFQSPASFDSSLLASPSPALPRNGLTSQKNGKQEEDDELSHS